MSGTKNIPEGKAATFGYYVKETKSKEDFVDFLNTHSTCPAVFKNGHRRNENIKKVLGWFRIDADEPKAAKEIRKKLIASGYEHIEKPSTNYTKKNKKIHFLIPVKKNKSRFRCL